MNRRQSLSNKGRARARSESGTATIEMSLIAPLFLLMLLCVADFGRVFYVSITLAHAARAGAQYGSFSLARSGDTAGMNQAATAEAQAISPIGVTSQRYCKCSSTGAKVNCVSGCGLTVPQVYVEVTTTRTFNTLIPYPGIPSQLNLSRTAIVRVQ